MKVAVTGSSGLIGTALVASLRADGHEVIRLVQRPPRAAGRGLLGPNVLAPACRSTSCRRPPRSDPAGARRRRGGGKPGPFGIIGS